MLAQSPALPITRWGQLLKLLKPQFSCFQMQLMTHHAQGLCEGSLPQSFVPGSVIGGSYYLSDHAGICRSYLNMLYVTSVINNYKLRFCLSPEV